MVREWEVWQEWRAGDLANSWGDPKKCAQGEVPIKGKEHWRLIKKAASLVEGKSILDVGCGFGHLFSFFRDRDYLGVDTSEHMLKRARAFFPEDKDRFQIRDVYDLSCLKEFDSVVAVGVIIHLPELEKVLKQLWSRTRICTVFSVWIGDSRTINTIDAGDKTVFRRRYTLEDFNQIFSKLDGLRKVEKYPHSYPLGNCFFKLWRA